MPDFLPSNDADLLTWMNNWSSMLTASGTTWGITAPQSAAMAAAVTSFSSALATATNPTTRTRESIALKDQKRAPMKSMARDLGRVVNAFPGMTNDVRISLGLTPRSGAITPVPPPSEPPELSILSVVNRTVKVKLKGVGSDRRGKPAGCSAAVIMSFVGAVPPADLREFTYEGSTTRATVEIVFPPTVPAGAQVWICALWTSPRDMSGPACMPQSTYLAGGAGSSTGAEPLSEAA